MLYSFDVFDTIITRKTATPKGIFSLVEKELCDNQEYFHIDGYVRNNFYQLRCMAEEYARKQFCTKDIEDITFSDIYEVLKNNGNLTNADIEVLKKLEIEVEYENIVGIENNIKKVKALINAGEKVVFISDMYLPSKIIRRFLSKVDELFSDIELYVSSEIKLCKRRGSIFPYIKDKILISYNDWLHIGDNKISDIASPKEYGIKTEWFEYPQLIDIEKNIFEDNCITAQFLIGASRNIRVNKRVDSDAMLIGSSSVGPILVGYVQWILNQSLKRKINRLYFIARDGYVLKLIADNIIQTRKYGIETKYIYASRKSWRMSGFDGNEKLLREIINYSNIGKCESLLDLANILCVDIFFLLRYIPDKYKKIDVLKSEQMNDILNCLYNNQIFLDNLYQKLKISRQNTKGYLYQECDFSDDKYAFVELQGTALTSICLCNLINNKHALVFYFYISKAYFARNYNFLSYVYPNFIGIGIVELFCRAPHGQTEKYNFNGVKYTPVMGEASFSWSGYKYNLYVEGVLEYVKEFNKIQEKYLKNIIDIRIITKYIKYVLETPDKINSTYWGEFPFSTTSNLEDIKKFAPILERQDIRDIFLLGKDYKGVLLPYSLKRSSKKMQEKSNVYISMWPQIVERYESIMHKQIDLMHIKKFSMKYSLIDWGNLPNRVVIYGAGQFGKVIHVIAKREGLDIVAWLDKDTTKKNIDGNISFIDKLNFDAVVVAILDQYLVSIIKNQLKKYGVIESHIYTFVK